MPPLWFKYVAEYACRELAVRLDVSGKSAIVGESGSSELW